ncbi:MucR family transcriptional regulator [Novosphingobium sp. ES2-1]|uniref:MucR family transcriptional regulator n=1 Tax=Novosphingobium sp. ES2-1 TaxID=2780074 RepID=UPI00187FBA5F|nr:MucR family transcriptional regulator [Novosphingobium sp. ES2-1]QOV94719.1 MucR family transcriptional regulator [Novosphingobium sp. ES2-1]
MSEDYIATREMLITLTSDIVAAHVSNNSVAVGDLPTLIANVHLALSGVNQPVKVEEVRPEPAVSIRASIKPDYIVCLEDGKKLKMLKRHLMSQYNMTPAEYRARWDLPADYPMVAPSYAETRRNLAKKIGLGRKPGQTKATKQVPAKRARKAPAAPPPHAKDD